MSKSTISAALLREHLHGGGAAYEEGQQAYRRNEGLNKCRYTDSMRRKAWTEGWQAERDTFMAS